MVLWNNLDKEVFKVKTPVKIDMLEYLTRENPNRPYVEYVLQGLKEGFRIGFREIRRKVILPNLTSIHEAPETFREAVEKEVNLGRYAGPFDIRNSPVELFRVNPCGLIPKKDTSPREYRVISHQSAPRGASVNDGISKEDFEIKYENVAHAAKWIRYYGHSCQLIKVDIKEAYRILPVHPLDQTLQGVICEEKLYFDRCLAFGNRAAPGIFCRFADLIAWIAVNQGLPAVLHYIDDFLIAVPRGGMEAKHLFLRLLEVLGIPYKPSKLEGPTTRLVFLGITLDTVAMTASIPNSKKEELLELMKEWRKKRWGFVDEVRSLIGTLIWMGQVMPQGRVFIQSFIELIKGRSGKRTRCALRAANRKDLDWWIETMPRWNGVYLLEEEEWIKPERSNLYTDASDIGGGAVYDKFFFHFKWKEEVDLKEYTIQFREMFTIIAAMLTFQRFWKKKRYYLETDSMPNIGAVAAGRCHNVLVHRLIHDFYAIQAYGSYTVRLRYVESENNKDADDLSRDLSEAFVRRNPHAIRLEVVPPTSFRHLIISDHG
jgi:hypothetical protein